MPREALECDLVGERKRLAQREEVFVVEVQELVVRWGGGGLDGDEGGGELGVELSCVN